MAKPVVTLFLGTNGLVRRAVKGNIDNQRSFHAVIYLFSCFTEPGGDRYLHFSVFVSQLGRQCGWART